MTNVWVGNLPPAATEQTLRELFEGFGAIGSCRVIPKGPGSCGMVLFEDAAAAAMAIGQMEGQPFEGKPLLVRAARDKAAQPAAAAGSGATALPLGGTNVWIGNLPVPFTPEELSALTAPFGHVTSSKILQDKATGRTEGAAMVNFASHRGAAEAVAQLNGQMLPTSTKPLIVKHAAPKQPVAPVFAAPSQYLGGPAGYGGGGAPGYGGGAVGYGGGGGGIFSAPSSGGGTNLWVGNLPPYYREAEIAALFGSFGAITSVKVLVGKVSQQPEGAALVNLGDPYAAAAAVQQLTGAVLEPGL